MRRYSQQQPHNFSNLSRVRRAPNVSLNLAVKRLILKRLLDKRLLYVQTHLRYRVLWVLGKIFHDLHKFALRKQIVLAIVYVIVQRRLFVRHLAFLALLT